MKSLFVLRNEKLIETSADLIYSYMCPYWIHKETDTGTAPISLSLSTTLHNYYSPLCTVNKHKECPDEVKLDPL